MLADRGLANNSEQPCLETGFTTEARFAFDNLQISDLQDFFGFCMVAAATTQRPAETGSVQAFQLSLQVRDIHPVRSHGFAFRVHRISRARRPNCMTSRHKEGHKTSVCEPPQSVTD